ncbi:MAG: metallophosphoesterase [Actinobacteria bacterium]|nr:metallophosphoesterase [Actinomycetota bacterium]
MTRRQRWLAWALVLVGLVVLVLALLRACAPSPVVHVIAVGDMACSPTDPKFNGGAGTGGECEAQRVSDAAVARNPQLLLGLGDYQYEVASAADYAAGYAPTWGRLKEITRPAIGNQELKVNKASTFYGYFGDVAPEPPGYYSYDLGAWHIVVLNTNCTVVEGGCGVDSPQRAWLEQDLAANAGRCILAYGHHPRWSNGIAGPDFRLDPFYSTMAKGHVSLYLSGHESDYERFPALNARHEPDPNGVRQFIVGTGGQSLYEPGEGDATWRETFDPIPSDFFDATHHGFLDLTLGDGSYDWSFVTDTGDITDSGTAACNPAA